MPKAVMFSFVVYSPEHEYHLIKFNHIHLVLFPHMQEGKQQGHRIGISSNSTS